MRVRKRYLVMLAISALIGGVVLFQAVTAVPPEPYVRLVHDRPVGPYSYEECRDGIVYLIYKTNDGRELPPVTDGQPCLDGQPPSIAARYHRE